MAFKRKVNYTNFPTSEQIETAILNRQFPAASGH